MTVINQNSISGINSVTAESNTIRIHDNGGVERVCINSGKVGIGTDNPKTGTPALAGLHVYTGASGQTGTNSANLVIEDSDDAEIALLCPSTNVGRIKFGDENSGNRGQVRYDHTDDSMQFTTGANVERLRITSTGRVGIGTDNPATEFHVQDGSDLLVALFESPNNNVRFRIKSSSSSLGQLEFADDTDADAGEIRYAHSTDKMTFHVGNNTLRVGITSESDGTSNLEIANGNLVFSTAGTGIDFSATTDATGMDSELLDDYEEGEWTPNPFQGTNGASATSSGTRNARYIRIGKLVHVCCYIQVSKGTNTTQNYEIYGLPFVPDGTDGLHSGLSVSYIDSWATNVSYVTCTAQPNSSRLLVRFIPAAGLDQINTARASDLDSTSNIIVGGTYITSA